MFGLSFGELLIIAVLALLLLGPERLPEAAKTFGKGLREIRGATDDLKRQVEQEIYADERKKAKPALVPPVGAQPVPGPSGPPPPATKDNVPGLDIALAEPPSLAEEPVAEAAHAAPAAPAAPAAAPAAPAAAAAPVADAPSTPPDRTP